MGAAASEELGKWASIGELTAQSRKMRIIPALPAECQIDSLRRLWRSLRWVAPGTELIGPGDVLDRMLLIVSGEAEALLLHTPYIPIFAEGVYLCEAALLDVPRGASEADPVVPWRPSGHSWLLRRWGRLPMPAQSLVEEFLWTRRRSCAQGFPGRVRTTRRSLIAELTRDDFRMVLRQAEVPEDLPPLSRGTAHVSALHNVLGYSAEPRQLGAQDVAALRVVCEAPINISCQAVPAALWGGGGLLFGSCVSRQNSERQAL